MEGVVTIGLMWIGWEDTCSAAAGGAAAEEELFFLLDSDWFWGEGRVMRCGED